MANFTLTVGADTVAGGAADNTVYATAATLNAGDSLTGGAGTDVLSLSGTGTFRIDQLAAFSGFEGITLNNFTSGSATLFLGNQSIAVTGYGSGPEVVYLGSGAITFQGGSGPYYDVVSASPSNWNAGNSIDGARGVYLSWTSDNAVYDLTTNTLTHIDAVYGDGTNLTVKVNSADAAGVLNFSGFGTNAKLVTSDATLDLSDSTVSGFTVASSNATGTNFTVHDLGTAFQITGGSGIDTITAQGFAFSADQRNAIFATASVERIADASGTYTAPPQNPNVFTLTTGSDTVTGTANNDTVNGTAATLNASDSLTGGAGTDVLALYGSGTFRVDQLATFTGFESITLNHFANGRATLYLGNQSIAVTGYGSGSEQEARATVAEVYLGSGAATLQGGSSSYNSFNSNSASNWNAGNVIDGGYVGYVELNLSGTGNAVYDLTTNTLSHINVLTGHGTNLTVKVNSADAAGVVIFSSSGTNAKLVTSDATLDLSHSTVSGFTVASSNATGTNFTVHDLGTAFQITGGSGIDTITAQGFAFSADQRNAIFATASVERIVDASGTYTADTAPTIASNGGGDTAAVSILENTTAVTTVTATDPDAGQTLTYSITGGGDAGKFTIGSTTGALAFVTAPNFEAPTDAGANNVYDVTVQVSDGNGGIDTQAIAVTVTPVNDVPVAVNDSYSTNEDTTLTVAHAGVSGNDTDADGDSLSAILVSGPAHGTVTLNADGAFSYAPAANYNGADSFTYKANDGQADSNVATVGLTVTPVNDAPVANDDIAGVAKGHAITPDAQHGVLINDGDLDGDGLSISAVNGSGANVGQAVVGTYGSLTVNTDGSYVYVANKGNPPPQIVAQDSFTYTASDGHGGTSTAQLTITITKPGAAYLAGTDGNDMLTAGNGPTVLDGGNGNDILTGGIKADALIGGHGNDTMTGGNGPDTFVFGANFGNDVITDLKPNTDAIQFDHSLFANFADVQAHAASDGHGNTVIAYDANDTITLQGVALLSLHANDFFFV